jgi:hypothetical protein
MHIIEVSLKFTPMPMSVQRKSLEDAQAVYRQVIEAMRSSQILELTCENQPEKMLALQSQEIAAVQMYEKSGSATSGKRPGFAFAE